MKTPSHQAGGGDAPGLLTGLLRDVSRSFYLTLRMLPGPIRGQIGLAYLLARASDTIADTEAVPLERRLAALRQFGRRVRGESAAGLDLGGLQLAQASPGEAALLQRLEEALQLMITLEAGDRQLVVQVLDTIISGQELDLLRFGRAAGHPQGITALQTEEELDDYTYRVAGCVGEFWTRLCRRHLFPRARLDETGLVEQGIQFGKGLQLVNILRDIPADLRKGRCYLPASELQRHRLVPSDLLQLEAADKVRPLYEQYLARAAGFLDAAWNYTLMLPYTQVRLRLACAWPVLIGSQTVEQLRTSSFLDPASPVKISRRQVKQILLLSVMAYPLPWVWKRLHPAGQK
jgi:farnesyl-diphosphate farnesyltransferase